MAFLVMYNPPGAEVQEGRRPGLRAMLQQRHLVFLTVIFSLLAPAGTVEARGDGPFI